MKTSGVLAAMLLAASVTAAAQVQRDRPATARDKPAEPAGTGVIAGIAVTADERQQPVRRVSVMLASGQIVVPRTVVTDDAGRFEFTGLAPGNYTLVGQKPAWVPAIYGARSASDTQGVPVAVANDQRVEGLRLPMVRGGVISGTVRLPGGQPAPNLSLQVLRVHRAQGLRQLSIASAGAQTDDLGAYRIFGLAPGEYVVQARSYLTLLPGSGTMRQVTNAEVRWAEQLLQQQQAASASATTTAPPPEGPPVTYAAVYFAGTTHAPDATVVSVRAGEERSNVDFALVLSPTAKVTGRVIGPDGEPSGGAMVQLEPELGEDKSGSDVLMRLMGSNRATTRPDGTFVLAGVTAGRYTLTARAMPRRPNAPQQSAAEAEMAQALAMLSAMGGMGGAESPAMLWASEEIAAIGQDIGPLSLSLREGLKIEGTVVVEGGGAPPDAATLRIGVSKPAAGGDPAMAMVTRMMGTSTGIPKEDGSFAVAGLMPGRYQFAVTGKPMRMSTVIPGITPAQSGWVVKSIKWRDQDLADTGLDLQADTPVTGVVVTLTSRAAELTGTVIDAAGRPTGAFPIVVFATDRAFWAAGSRRVIQAQPASDGRFSVIGLPAGDYFVAAVTRLEPGDLGSQQFLEELIPASLKITIRDGEKKTQDLKLSGGS